MSNKTPPIPHRRTKLVQADIGADKAYNAVTPPLYLSANYKFNGFDNLGVPYDYGRGGNPNRDALGKAVAELEGGAAGVVTASGLAAIDLVFNLFKADDLVIAPHDCYGGTHRMLTYRAKQKRMKVEFINQQDPAAITEALAKKPKIILIETPSNPLMRLVDIEAICHAAHKVGTLIIADNTFMSPARCNPIALGADFVVHSTTKYINGHSDVVGGVLVSKTKEHGEELAWWANCIGVTGAPFDSFMTLRGLRTLFARVDTQEFSAIHIANWLNDHDAVSHVYYTGLKSHPDHDLAKRQQRGPGAMISFELAGGREATQKLLEGVKIFQLAESLGGVESLISHPETMTHRGMAPEARAQAGLKDNLVRLSIGLEHVEDLIEDLDQNL